MVLPHLLSVRCVLLYIGDDLGTVLDTKCLVRRKVVGLLDRQLDVPSKLG